MNQMLKNRMKSEKYKLVSIDLFSGPGGLCTGFKWAGILPLIAIEWTDTTVETYSASHNAEVMHLDKYINEDGVHDDYLNQYLHDADRTLLIHGDINLVNSNLIKLLLLKRYGIDSNEETVDVVSGGAPCESFSMAGQRTANDERDDLFSNILRISRTVRSKYVLFENVKGLLSKAKDGKKGAIFEYICDSFEDKNAETTYKLVSRDPKEILLKAVDYGVPQKRERLFLVGIRSDLDLKFSYPLAEYGPSSDKPYVTVEEAIMDLPQVEMGEETTDYSAPCQYISENHKRFIAIMRGEYKTATFRGATPKHLIKKGLFASDVISCQRGPGHTKKKQQLLALIPENGSMKTVYDDLVAHGNIEKYRDLFPTTIYGSRNRRLIKGEPSFTVTSHCLDEILHPTLNRAITPREAARLQSFPDWYQFAGPYVQFHGDRIQDKYEQIGDAIPPLLAYAIAVQIVKSSETKRRH